MLKNARLVKRYISKSVLGTCLILWGIYTKIDLNSTQALISEKSKRTLGFPAGLNSQFVSHWIKLVCMIYSMYDLQYRLVRRPNRYHIQAGTTYGLIFHRSWCVSIELVRQRGSSGCVRRTGAHIWKYFTLDLAFL